MGSLVLSAGAHAATQALQMAMPSPQVIQQQMATYNEERPKNIIELQPFRATETAKLPFGQDAQLISLNPNVNSWFILQIGPWNLNTIFHLQNPDPAGQSVALEKGPEPAILLTQNGKTFRCEPWKGDPWPLVTARESHQPFAPICGGRLFLRNPSQGHWTRLEWTANFLRKNIIGGDMIVGFVKNTFFQDAFAETDKTVAQDPGAGQDPVAAAGLQPAQSRHPLVLSRLGIDLVTKTPHRMVLGEWYPVAGVNGVFASAMQPGEIDPAILHGPGRTNPLDTIESRSMDYFVAFDLSRFNLGYAMGASSPSLGWSERPPASVVNKALPGPDGISNPAPVVPLGMMNPVLRPRLVATFTAGFKRRHGAFKVGPFAYKDHGTHYGFIQQGVIMSKLWPGLSTIFVMDDGSIHMRTWTEADNALLPHVRFARQNGVPLLERNPNGGAGIPGEYVADSEKGNWSGAANLSLRTLRAGACLLENNGKRFFVFAFFSTATPSAMARTFEGYGCRYAMLLDMNALEHTYLALYDHSSGKTKIEHLLPGMAVVDKKENGHPLARFVDYPDNRDFFYMTLK
ncbi:MAG: hypothetical protein KGK00_08780 [Paracoccaceae bacterium]|nr:hypothetical protein [Paracoccaceae bacterium]